MTADKKVKIAGIVSVTVILFQIIDVFFLRSQFQLSSINIISRIVSLVLIILLSGLLGFNIRRFCFK